LDHEFAAEKLKRLGEYADEIADGAPLPTALSLKVVAIQCYSAATEHLVQAARLLDPKPRCVPPRVEAAPEGTGQTSP
jgi:hypothetical protein